MFVIIAAEAHSHSIFLRDVYTLNERACLLVENCSFNFIYIHLSLCLSLSNITADAATVVEFIPSLAL